MAVTINGSTGVTTNNSVYTDASGNTGIGTASPTYKLDVSAANAEARLNGSNASRMLFTGSSYTWAVSSNYYTAGQFVIANTAGGSGINDFAIDASGNTKFNSGYGSAATAYGCRAWVNFNGTGTVAIRASGNVSSITDNGTGDYTANFTTAMPDANYSALLSTKLGNNEEIFVTATGSCRVKTTNGAFSPTDSEIVCLSIFR